MVLCHLAKIEKQYQIRKHFATLYAEGFSDVPTIITPQGPKLGHNACIYNITQFSTGSFGIARNQCIIEYTKKILSMECAIFPSTCFPAIKNTVIVKAVSKMQNHLSNTS